MKLLLMVAAAARGGGDAQGNVVSRLFLMPVERQAWFPLHRRENFQ